MKNFISTLTLILALTVSAFAQQSSISPISDRGAAVENSELTEKEKQQRVARAKLNVEARAQAARALNLTPDEIDGFTPFYMDYARAKDALVMRRNNRIKRYKKEMMEDDSEEDEREETADFIEDLWEHDIRMLELKKDYFDLLEDIIPYEKALQFFTMEDMINSRAKRKVIMDMLPTMKLYVPVTLSYQREIDDFNNWKKVNIDGKVGVDHNFTYNGLSKLMNAAEQMAMSEGINVPNFSQKKQMVMDKAGKMKENWKSMTHADLAKSAFTETANVLTTIASDSRFANRSKWTSKLMSTANSINVDRKLTDQASTVYTFFDTAEKIVNDLVSQANNAK